MTEENRRAYEERWERIKTAVAIKEPDRVPFIPKVGAFVANGYGVTQYDIAKDARNLEPCILAFLKDYEPDMMWTGSAAPYPIDPCELMGAQYIRFPGPTFKRPLNAPFQILDGTYMEDDEFDEFLTDPTHFMITKVMPRKYKNLSALSKLYGREIYDTSVLMEIATLGDHDVKDAIHLLIQCGEMCKRFAQQLRYISELVEEAGFPTRGGTILAPFDSYADSLRGLVQSLLDVKEIPDLVLETVNRIEKMNTKRAIEAAKKRGDKFLFIPLHAASDEFMSPKDYEKFYWPGLKRTIEAIVEAGIIPYVFCEGKYNTRLEFLKDVPKGKVVYMFEQVDIKRAKQVLGDTACICGNLPSTLLATGTPEQVIEKTKELIDICAPGGGFIMDCSIVVDVAKHENFAAWHETTINYGTYR